MPIMLWLMLGLAATMMLTLFPEVASQTLRIEAFGWVFETRQGAFVIALLALLLVAHVLTWLLRIIMHGPGHAWRSLSLSSRRREEKRLQQALADCINMQHDCGRKALQRKWRMLPRWLAALLATLPIPPHEQRLKQDGDFPLRIALAARIASEPDADPKPDLALKKVLVQAWSKAYPKSPLARLRMAETLQEEGSWREAVDIWELLRREKHLSQQAAALRLVPAYCRLADLEPEKRAMWLQKAYELAPHDEQLAIALGRAWLEQGEEAQATRLWMRFIEKHAGMHVAAALLDKWRAEALAHYRRLERVRSKEANAAMLWLKAELAQAAGLDGLADEHIRTLIERHACKEGWQSLARWQMQKGDFRQACESFSKAIETASKTGHHEQQQL